LSDSQFRQLQTTASAVSQPLRAAFLRRVADLMRGRSYDDGDGAFFRLCQPTKCSSPGRSRRRSMRPWSRSEAARTAYHEAGHAVIAKWMGLPIRRATVERVGDDLGKVLIATQIKRAEPHQVRAGASARVVAALAGPIAECMALADDVDDPRTLTKYASTDLDYAAALEKRWDEIQRVAAALVQRRTLTSAEIRKAMNIEAEGRLRRRVAHAR
jgi:ATP-dependent Zn protease